MTPVARSVRAFAIVRMPPRMLLTVLSSSLLATRVWDDRAPEGRRRGLLPEHGPIDIRATKQIAPVTGQGFGCLANGDATLWVVQWSAAAAQMSGCS